MDAGWRIGLCHTEPFASKVRRRITGQSREREDGTVEDFWCRQFRGIILSRRSAPFARRQCIRLHLHTGTVRSICGEWVEVAIEFRESTADIPRCGVNKLTRDDNRVRL